MIDFLKNIKEITDCLEGGALVCPGTDSSCPNLRTPGLTILLSGRIEVVVVVEAVEVVVAVGASAFGEGTLGGEGGVSGGTVVAHVGLATLAGVPVSSFSEGDLTGVAGLGASILLSSFSDMLVIPSLVSSSSAEPCAWLWWYLSPLMCLYFLLQLGSGHSNKIGLAGGEPLGGVGGGAVALLLLFSSSSGPRAFLFAAGSGLGGTKEDVVAAVVTPVVEAGLGLAAGEPWAAPLRPLPPPFLNLLWTELLVSVKLLRSFPGVALAAARPRFPRPFGVLASRSLVGESQNRGGAQSCLVQSSNVPTYVLPLHVTFTTNTPATGESKS